MKERPILFSGPMVRAILAGRKTQTRRVIRPQPQKDADGPRWAWEHHKNCLQIYRGEPVREQMLVQAPYDVGTRLWVREGWMQRLSASENDDYRYRADFPGSDVEKKSETALRWRPSIHMPRAASRLSLEVTGVRVERVGDISKEDAIAEGSCIRHNFTGPHIEGFTVEDWQARACFAAAWQELNGKRGYGWFVNPWVWVVSFKRVG